MYTHCYAHWIHNHQAAAGHPVRRPHYSLPAEEQQDLGQRNRKNLGMLTFGQLELGENKWWTSEKLVN